jgi:hypothetical protein
MGDLSALRSAAVVGALLIVASPPLGAGASAKHVQVDGPRVISSDTPLPQSCDGLRQDTDPMVAADAGNPRHLVATWDVDDHKSNVTAVSRDTGRTWRISTIPGISKCTGGASDQVVDPFVAIGARGRALFTSLPLDVSGFLTNRSTDGGATWSSPASADPSAGLTDDLPSVVADPLDTRRALLPWSHFTYTGDVQTGGDARFARSRDGGASWSKPTEIRVSPTGKAIVESRLGLYPSHTLLDVFGEAPAQPVTAPQTIYATRSRSGGGTWSRPVRIARVAQNAIIDPDSGKAIYEFCCLYSVAIARRHDAYVAYTTVAGTRSGKVLVVHSDDGGKTWGRPHAVVSLPAQTLIPSIAVAQDGTLGLTWYDFRRDKRGDKALTTDYWFAYSRDHGRRWHRSHLAGPFDLRSSRRTARPVGVYEGLAGLPHGFAATFIQASPRARFGAEDVFFARVTPPQP